MNTTLLPPQNQSEQVDIRLLHMNEVARRLGVSLQRAYELGRQGLLPIVRLGRQMRVEEHQLLAWIAEGGASIRDSPDAMLGPGSEFRVHRHWFVESAMAAPLETDFAVPEKDRL